MSLTPSTIEAVRNTLVDDVAACWFALKKSDEQVNRRNYIRAVFSMVEGFISALKAYVIDECDAGRFTPSDAERAALYEETFDVDDTGKARNRPSFIALRSNVRFTFDIFARAHGVTETPDYSTSEWQAFQTAVQVRHRVTHPKVSEDLDVTDNELEAAEKALSWFLEATFVVYVEGRAKVLAKLQSVS